MKNIVFTGGGTAGHITPNLAIISELQGYKIYYFGTNGMEKDIISKYPNITFVEIPSAKFIRGLSIKNFLIPIKIFNGIQLAKKKLQEIKPSLIFSKGGFVSIPTSLAGQKLKIPVLTHESDLSIGLANRIIAKKSRALLCSFQETAEKYGDNAIYSGSPIRNCILSGNKEIIIRRHNISTTKPIILIIGGSLGSKYINNFIQRNLNTITQKYYLIHIVGKNNINSSIKKNDYLQIDYANDIENYLNLCDIVISRAGSNTLFELLCINKPSILIPLPKKSSRGDQLDNANLFHKKEIFNLIYQEELEISILMDKINETIKNKNKYINNMKNFPIQNGNKKIISEIYKYSL